MRRYFILCLAALFAFGSMCEAYFLNTSEIIGRNKWVLQSGYASKDFGSQITSTKGSAEIKLAYGFADPWDGMVYFLPGILGEANGQNFNTIGVVVEYGLLKMNPQRRRGNPPLDLSFVGGLERTGFSNGASEIGYNFGFILGKSYALFRSIFTPFFGSKIAYLYPSSSSQTSNDFEATAGLRLGFSPSLAFHAEGGYHWLTRGSARSNSSGLSAGIAWNF